MCTQPIHLPSAVRAPTDAQGAGNDSAPALRSGLSLIHNYGFTQGAGMMLNVFCKARFCKRQEAGMGGASSLSPTCPT